MSVGVVGVWRSVYVPHRRIKRLHIETKTLDYRTVNE